MLLNITGKYGGWNLLPNLGLINLSCLLVPFFIIGQSLELLAKEKVFYCSIHILGNLLDIKIMPTQTV